MSEPVASGSRSLRYSSLLAALVALLASTAVTLDSAAVLALRQLVSTAVLVAALFSVGRDARLRIAGVALGAPALVAGWTRLATGLPAAQVVEPACSAAFLAFVTTAIFASLLRSTRVTTDTILGGICVYVLIAVAFAYAFSLAETLAPGSLLGAGRPASEETATGLGSPVLYFSFVTISTLGYGDIVPLSSTARTLAASEAVLGQLYIAVFIARLVGLHLAGTRDG